MNRGDRRELIFADDEDRLVFVATLGEACGKTGWEVQAYNLMPNRSRLVEELGRLGWGSAELERRPRGDSGKVRIARRLRTETTMSRKWIAERLCTGSVSMVAHCLQWNR